MTEQKDKNIFPPVLNLQLTILAIFSVSLDMSPYVCWLLYQLNEIELNEATKEIG